MNPEFAPLFELGRAERLQLVEDLWDSLAEESEDLPVPDWKATELRRRKGLISVWEAARREKKAPLHLLGAVDLATETCPTEQNRIVHGVRPGIPDFRDGCFMERSAKLEAALSIIYARWAVDSKERRPSIPVFWITGPSGAGKSVLLLQLARELLADGQVEAVNFVVSYSHALPRALDNVIGTSIPVIVVGDDLYSPDNRDPAIWREVGELSADHTFPGRFAILTCGPLEQLKAFKRECERHRTLDPVEIVSEALNLDERATYHAWYQERTGTEVPLSREDIFVAVAWIYELYREEKLTPEAFARRFDKRLQDLGMAQAGNAALALNLYGLNAPEALFTDHRADLAQLASERIWRLAKSGTGTLAGRFFHPQISRLIYDALVPREELVRRAEDIARGFDAMLEEGEAADAFLAWLGSGKIGKSRARGALMLDEAMRIEILKALWPYFRGRGAVDDVIPRLLRWHQATLGAGIELGASGIKARIQSWWQESDEDEPRWSLLFQMVWDAANEPERSTLMARRRAWLENHIDAGSWPWIYQRFLKFSQADGDLRVLGLRWLDCNPAHPYWPGVWGSLFATLDSPDQPQKEREELLRVALKAIPVQPECEADLPVWERTAKLDPPVVDFLSAVIHKLAMVRSPYKVEKGVDLLLRFVAPGELVIRLWTALQETMAGRAWPHIWTNFLVKRPDEQGLLALGRDWLTDRENQPEWTYVWQNLIDQDFEHDTLLPRGRDWLTGRENQPEWSHVWRTLIDQDFERDTCSRAGATG